MQQLGSHQQRCTPVQTWDFLWICYADVLLKKRIVLTKAATSRNSKPTSIKFTNQLERTFSSPPKMRKQPMTEHSDMDFQEQQKVWLYNPRRVKGRTPKLQSNWEGPYNIVKKINDIVFCIQKTPNTKRRSFILIDWQSITKGNSFCFTHGYFEPWFFPWDTGQMPGQGQRWGTTVCELPLVSKNYRQDSTRRWWHNDTQKWRFKDESRINPLKSRRFYDDFKMIIICFQEIKMDQFKRRALWPCAKDQPAWRWCHFDSVLEEENYSSIDGPFGRVRRISPLDEDAFFFIWS